MSTVTDSTPDAASRGGPAVEVIVKEELDTPAAARLDKVLDDLLDLRPALLVIDLADCPFLDAAAVDVLLRAHRQAWRTGGRLALRAPSPRVQRILRLARVDHVLHTIPPRDRVNSGADTYDR